jgi:outer membrane protein TolC
MKPIKILILFLALIITPYGYSQRIISLEESKQLALENNAAAKNGKLEIEASRQQKKAAFTSFFPSVMAGGAVFSAQKNMVEINSPGGNLPVYDGNVENLLSATQFAFMPPSTMGMLKKGAIGMLNIMQPVFAGGRIVNGNRLAELGQEVSGYKYQMSRNDVLLKTEEQYWLIVQLNEKIKTIQLYEDLLKNLLARVEDSYKSGLITKNDVLKVKLKLSEALLNKSKLENGKKLAGMAFCQFVGIKYDSTLVFNNGLENIEAPQACYVDNQAALIKRNEYALLQKSVEAEELQTKIKLGSYLPSVSVGLAGIYMKLDENDGKTIGMANGMVQIPISGWWEASHTLSERNIKEEIARNEFRDKSELLLLQMEKAWQDLNDAFKQVALSRDSKAQAEENLKVNDDSYKNGISNLSDLLEAQALLQQTRDQLTESLGQYKVKFSNYLIVTGR